MFYPHTATVELASNRLAGNKAKGVEYAAPVQVACHIQPATLNDGYGADGPAVGGQWLLIAPISARPSFAQGARVSWNGIQFQVDGDPKAWMDGLPTDHIEVNLTEKQYAEVV